MFLQVVLMGNYRTALLTCYARHLSILQILIETQFNIFPLFHFAVIYFQTHQIMNPNIQYSQELKIIYLSNLK
jgi:hypothetical protein